MEELQAAVRTLLSSSCLRDMNRHELVDRIAAGISLQQPLSSGDKALEQRLAADVVDAIWRVRLQDPLPKLPTDIGLLILDFFDTWEVARLRAVSKEWFQLGNKLLARATHLAMQGFEDGSKKRSMVELVCKRCPALRSLSIDVYDVTGYDPADMYKIFAACHRVRSLELISTELQHDPDLAPHMNDDDAMCSQGFDDMRCLVDDGTFRWLVTLDIDMIFGDGDARTVAGELPCLRALFIRSEQPANGVDDDDLTSEGVATLINGLPALDILFLHQSYMGLDLTDEVPACRSGLRRFAFFDASITDFAMSSLLMCVGTHLRTIVVERCGSISDVSVRCIADRCPNIETLMLDCCDNITPACLPALAEMTRLQDFVVRYPDKFTDKDLDWLVQHTGSPVLHDYRERLSEYGDRDSYLCAVFSFDALLKAEGASLKTLGQIGLAQ